MVKPVWKLLSFFLALGGFLAVAGMALANGEELVWVAAKAVGAFLVCRFVLNQLGIVLFVVVGRQEQDADARG